MLSKRYVWNVLLVMGAMTLSAACGPSTPDPTQVAQAAQTQVAADHAAETEAAKRVATGVAATLTAQPTDTPTLTPTSTDTPEPTDTPKPTKTSTPKPTATITHTPRPTSPPVSPTPSPQPTSASIYGFTGGPDGYITDIDCTRGGANCSGVMPPGDVSFTFVLISGPDTPWTLFEKYGLSVEKDGVNVANMFMFVDAGFLPPDAAVQFGASRNFTDPGRYVIRSSGCMTTTGAPCAWATMAGTTVTFTIQP